MVTIESWQTRPDICGQIYAVDEKNVRVAQVFYAIIQHSAEIRGLDNRTGNDEILRLIYGKLIDILLKHGVTYAWGLCDHNVGLHISSTYPGWVILGYPDIKNNVIVERHLGKD